MRTRILGAGVAVVTAAPLLLTSSLGASAAVAPVGQGFNLNASDLRFILKQIKIAEQHADTYSASNPCGSMRGTGADQVPSGEVGDTLPWGLRLVDGSCNNIVPGKANVGAADQKFPRLVPKSLKQAEFGDPDGPTGPAGPRQTSYTQTSGTVIDSQPRTISNLVVDQTVTNPAAVEAAGEAPDITPSGAFFIPNTAPDTGLSAPFNSWFTLFGQFFDHGLDLVNKSSAQGTVFVPLNADDPLYSTAPGALNFMTLTRAQHSGDHEAVNQTTPWVDQSQTYSSHPSHQAFLRKYAVGDHDFNAATPDRLMTTGALVTGAGDGMATWADVKAQAANAMGIRLTDADVGNLPLLATDPYGRFMRGANGLPQMIQTAGPDGILTNDPATPADESADNNALVEGNLTTPVPTTGMAKTGHAFLDDIAHHAVPKPGFTPDSDSVVTPGLVPCERPGLPANCVNQYDDELLNAHFIAGDGRVNENIGLTTVHHVFHSEHNRLVDNINSMIVNADNTSGITDAEEADWKATNRYTARDGSYDYGERLFQAARFVTEMEYQHLAFEEFIRKVQPMVAPFGEGGTGYNTSINPAIKAEFAHAVYRFGHSMLTESVDRINVDGTRNDIDLFDAFLNPPEFMAAGQTPDDAAGDVVRGMTRQVGNEIDEFVTEALRNQLLGLPLDLATLNMARARDTGIPSLNAARRVFFAESNNSALAAYQSWADFSFVLRHPMSLNNFIAAYGKHPSITGATTMAGKRAAADRILAGPAGADGILTDDQSTAVDETTDNGPEDSYAFLNSSPHMGTDPDTGEPIVLHSTWVDPANTTNTGVDDIDLWSGGLAEKQFVFGGLLGPTFNYVFEQQMEDLQFGDRFYYLARTAGLNMLTQLEGNSFAELIQRNTNVSGLPADSFSTPALIFDLANLGTEGPVLNDPATEWNEAALLTRMPDGTIRYGGPEHVVFNGTAGVNRVWSSEGDDTIRGNDGNDWMQGGDGNDNHIGGLGDDILLDTNGDDTLKGGDGNDTLSSGQGFAGDLNQGGRGNDFIDHDDMAEAFAGPGDDYVLGGPEDDTVFGDDGDDWLENGASTNGTGGGAFNLLQGDNGAPFQDDPNEPGHDVLIGYGGENDNDAEGGDDVMLNGPGIQRNEGMLGFDYATHDGDPVAADSDLDLTGLLPPSVETNKDRFDLVETLSGWNLNDVLRGDDRDAAAMQGHELTAEGAARVAGLSGVLGGATTFTGGNILMGGAGTDLIEGRGGDDVIDGDAQLNVRISVRSAADPTTQIDSVETLSGVSARLIAGTVNPGQLRIVREIQTPANGTAVDTAVFSGPRADYDITFGPTSTTVVHARGTVLDGTDTLRNIEQLQFSDRTIPNAVVPVVAASAPTGLTATVGASNVAAGNGSVNLAWTAPADDGGAAITGYRIQVRTGTTVVRSVDVAATPTTATVTGLTGGTAYNFRVRAITSFGLGVLSTPSGTVTPLTLAPAPGTPVATRGNASAALTWTAPPATGGSPITGYRVQVRTGATVVRTDILTGTATSTTVANLTNGTAYNFRVRAVTAVGLGALSAQSNVVTPATVPGAPVIGTAVQGAPGGAITATANWTAPAVNGGSVITGYRVFAVQFTAAGVATGVTVQQVAPANVRTLQMTLGAGQYRFQVTAINAVGQSVRSAQSNQVVAR
ncbi:peroxidase family protein [Knoellia sp. CPCC 206435]|uniref:peroxidase family protein n=1 Tax=Knoellia terrae TaxID=3404797 RepID=UPI003B436AD1